LSRVPLVYTSKVLELFKNPKNLGKMDDASVSAQAGSPACGDVINIYLKVESRDGEEYIEKASFESYGCAANIAAASVVTELAKGLTLKDAWLKIGWKQVSDELGGLPPVKRHCSVLAVGALKRAIRKYYAEVKGYKPEWLPSDLTPDERQALEAEEMIDRLYRRFRDESEKDRPNNTA